MLIIKNINKNLNLILARIYLKCLISGDDSFALTPEDALSAKLSSPDIWHFKYILASMRQRFLLIFHMGAN